MTPSSATSVRRTCPMSFAGGPDSRAGGESHEDRPSACPVCGLPARTRHACAEGDWTVRSARRLGPVTGEMRADFDRKLAAARRQFDATAAALVSADPGRLARWIRGGTPSPGEWSAARLAAARAAGGARDE